MGVNRVTIDAAKSEMKKYRDLYGGDLLDIDEIDNCKTRKELSEIIEKHRAHLEMCACDASSDLDRLKKRIGLQFY